MSELRSAAPGELPLIYRLLESAGLPTEGAAAHLGTFVVAEAEGRIVGCVGLEIFPPVALLRSLVVAPGAQGAGLGAQLVHHILDLARGQHVRTVYLLTTTAEAYFPRFGFQTIDRGRIDAKLQASSELHGACPQTAVCMRLHLSS